MHVTRSRLSATVTTYHVQAHLGPFSCAWLVEPNAGTKVIGWRTGEHSELLWGQWISPYSDLIVQVVGTEWSDDDDRQVDIGQIDNGHTDA
jgi:hypothetical protein